MLKSIPDIAAQYKIAEVKVQSLVIQLKIPRHTNRLTPSKPFTEVETFYFDKYFAAHPDVLERWQKDLNETRRGLQKIENGLI